MAENYYNDTAFNSQALRDLPAPRQTSGLSTVQKVIRTNPISSRGLQSREYLSYTELGFIELLNNTSKENLEEMKQSGHECQRWPSLKNPKVVAQVIRNIFGFFFFGTVLTAVLVLLVRRFEFEAIYYSAVMLLIPYSVYFLLGFGLKHNWFRDKNNILVNRRTGLVTFTWENQRVSLPFDEFDVCMPMGMRPSGSHDYYLRLVHKYSDRWLQAPAGRNTAWEVEQDWEFWQQYMDISQPLPDVPKMEPFRERDPVTAAWDQQHNRPKDYWKNMPMDKAEAMKAKSRQAAETFPWGLTRKQALAKGWQPSGVGEGDWRK